MAERPRPSSTLRVHALTTIGSAKEFSGDTTRAERDIERAVEIGRAANSPMVARRAQQPLGRLGHSRTCFALEQLRDEAFVTPSDIGDAPLIRFLEET